LFDALRSVIGAMQSGRLLLGGGSLHIAAASAVREAAEAATGRQRLAMEAYARALEAVPGALIENAGANRLDVLLDLRAAHRAGRSNDGVTVAGINGAIEHAWANAATLEHAIEVATEAVCGLLRIDQVISARGD
ncbi:MAG: thermosome subunit, partial [Euryarchaeota archaeon]|nr:thermosome subunit [Euryarchaeota archaeon]